MYIEFYTDKKNSKHCMTVIQTHVFNSYKVFVTKSNTTLNSSNTPNYLFSFKWALIRCKDKICLLRELTTDDPTEFMYPLPKLIVIVSFYGHNQINVHFLHANRIVLLFKYRNQKILHFYDENHPSTKTLTLLGGSKFSYCFTWGMKTCRNKH